MKNQKSFIQNLFLVSLVVLIVAASFGVGVGALKVAKGQKKQQTILVEKQAGINITENIKTLEGLITEGDLNKIKIKVKEIEQDYQQVIKDLRETRNYLENKKVDNKILVRLDEYEKRYEESIGNLVNSLKEAKKLEDYQNQLKAVKDVIEKNQTASYEKVQNPRPFKVSGEGKVIKQKASHLMTGFQGPEPSIISNLKLEKNDNQGIELPLNNSEQILQQNVIQTESIPPEYLAEGGEIEFSQSIKNLADSLDNNPLKILNYVKNNVDYVPYYGTKKGSDATLIEKAGNDFDQAALLIALLRYSGYPSGYKRGQIKLSLNQIMNLLGVEDPIVAAKLLSKTYIPYLLYTDQDDNPLFFLIEHIWVEAYITYDYTRGINQDGDEADKVWVPMDASLKTVYYSQVVDIIDEMGFDVNSFYENYLNGNYDQLKPIEAYRQEIENYLSANHPDLIYEDILTKSYKQKENLEFIPNTLPYEVVENISEYSQIPTDLKHKLQFKITNKEQGIELLNYTTPIHQIADKQLVLTYVAASSEDQEVIDLYDSIYDIVPLSLVHMKPVIKVNGEIVYGGDIGDPEIILGEKQDLVMRFLMPKRENSGIIEYKEDIIEKEAIVGNDEGIAINTDRIVLPEVRPSQDTQTTEFLSGQKLYRTALDFLDRLQKSYEELAGSLGSGFTNAATRAIVFNGIDINYQMGEPYSFSWKGLRIDSSSLINYFSYFGQDIKRNQIRFMYVGGLEASLNESSIFEEDFDIESMSTVKGLRMINQSQIPERSVIKITSANRSVIDTLNVSSAIKQKFRTSVDSGNIIYTASQQFTYGNFTGLVYIDLDPETGDGGYIIGEGLNGGYTVGNWSESWIQYWLSKGDIADLTATFLFPSQDNQEFQQGQKIEWSINYEGTVYFIYPVFWNERGPLDTREPGTHLLLSRYGAGGDSVRTYIVIEPIPDGAADDPIKVAEGFNEKFVIKNAAFNNYNSMTEDEIQAFLDEKGEDYPNHISKREFAGHRTAYWIKKGADMAGINPKILLAKLQCEQGLIIGPRSINPQQEWLDWAINAGYTEDIVYAKYRGFTTQMILGSEEFLRKWYNKAGELDYVLTIDIDESTTSNNWQYLKVLNAATFSLYKFTPHIYEGGRLVYTVYSSFFGIDNLGGPTE